MNGKRIFQFLLVLVLLVGSFATAARAQAWSSCPSVYYVQPGDWLAKIARNCGVSLSSLYAANPWTTYTYYIYPGQVIYIPGGYDSGGYYCGPGYDYYGSYYIVCRGDTLGGIAMYYGVTVNYLQWRNGIANANRIYAGQLIRP
ncbi:MAG: LysM domain-containing protein [Anaerolineales bacterium]|nr:MAG: LysM domain-containing protein [Anaerolineales bacterium]